MCAYPSRKEQGVSRGLPHCSTSSLQRWCGSVPWRQLKHGRPWGDIWNLGVSSLLWSSVTSQLTILKWAFYPTWPVMFRLVVYPRLATYNCLECQTCHVVTQLHWSASSNAVFGLFNSALRLLFYACAIHRHVHTHPVRGKQSYALRNFYLIWRIKYEPFVIGSEKTTLMAHVVLF